MANEAVLMVETELPVMFTCADGVGIEKGAILKLADDMTVSLADGDADVCGGIAAEEKIASDGKTKIAVYRGGIFKVLAGGAVTVGKSVMTYAATGAANELIDGTNAAIAGKTFGIALETVADTNTFLMELRPSAAVNVLA